MNGPIDTAVKPLMSADLRKIATATVVALALCGASLLGFYAELRFDDRDTKVLENLDFAQGGRHWTARGDALFVRKGEPKTLVIPASNPAAYAGRIIADPGQYEHLRISAQVRSVDLSEGQPWHGGTIALLAYDAAGKRARHWPQQVIQLKATAPWQRVSTILPVIPNAKRLFLVAYASGLTGFFEVRDFEVTALTEKPVFKTLRLGVLAAWLALWLWLVRALMLKTRRTPAKVLAFALANLLLVAGVTPQPLLNDTLKLLLFRGQDVYFAGQEVLTALAPASDDISSTADGSSVAAEQEQGDQGAADQHRAKDDQERASAAQRNAQDRARQSPSKRRERESAHAAKTRSGVAHSARQYWVPQWQDLDKTEHIFGFAMLAFFVGIAYRGRRAATRLLTLAVFAASIQTLQLYSVTRDADIGDVRADLLGAMLGTLIAASLLFALRRLVPAPGASSCEIA